MSNEIVLDIMESRFINGIDNIRTLRKMVNRFDFQYESLTALSVFDGKNYNSVSYREVKETIENLGGYLLSKGVKKGEVIGLMSENRVEWPVAYLAAASIGAIIVPLDIFFTKSDLTKVVEFLDLRTIFISGMFSELVSDVVNSRKTLTDLICFDELTDTIHRLNEDNSDQISCNWIGYPNIEKSRDYIDLYNQVTIEPEDSAALIYMTANSYAELTHGSLTANVYGMLEEVHEKGKYFLPGEKTVATLAFHHSWPTVGGFLMPMASYGEAMILPKFTSQVFLKAFSNYAASYAIMVPLVLEKTFNFLTRKKVTLPTLKYMIVGGAATHISILNGMRDINCKVLQMYGLSECSPTITVTSSRDNPLGSIGKVIKGLEYKVRETHGDGIGELLVRGTSLMKGYYNQEVETKYMIKDGWLYTGDVVKADANNNLYVVGRCRELVVNKGGKNIYPPDLENHIRQNEYVSDVKVVARIDDKDGEYPFAIIIANRDALHKTEVELGENFTADSLSAFMLKQVQNSMSKTAAYKTPKGVEILLNEEVIARNEFFYFGDYYLTDFATDNNGYSEMQTSTDVVDASHAILDRYFINQLFDQNIYDLDAIDRYSEFDEWGVDSLSMLSVRYNIEKQLGCNLQISLLGEGNSVADLTQRILFDKDYEDIKLKVMEFSLGINENSTLDPNLKKTLCDFILDESVIANLQDEELDSIYGELLSIHS